MKIRYYLPAAAAVIAIAACGTTSAKPVATFTPPPATPAAAQAAPTATPTPTPSTPTTVTFTISGYAPGDGYGNGPTITYGSSADEHQATPGSVDGKVTYKVPFDGTALYYDIDAQLAGTGHLTCKITVTGPGDQPLVVARGSASGGYAICSAQAAPTDQTGLTWTEE